MSKAINRITRNDVAQFRYSPFLDTYQRVATKSAIYPGQGLPLGMAYVALKINGEAGEIAEHVGKAMRDDNFGVQEKWGSDTTSTDLIPLTPERHALITKEIGDALWYLSAMCNELGITLSEAALTNLEKLCDRSKRDALRGSGDER